METKLYIGNMSHDTTEEELRTLLSEAGTVGSVNIIMDHQTGQSRGFAFVTMNSQDEAEKAIRMFNEKNVKDNVLKVNLAKPREERPSEGRSHFPSGVVHRSRGGSNKRH